jgi:hypothetical protein
VLAIVGDGVQIRREHIFNNIQDWKRIRLKTAECNNTKAYITYYYELTVENVEFITADGRPTYIYYVL